MERSGVWTVGNFAFTSCIALHGLIRSLQSQNKDARALKAEVGDLAAVLSSLLETIASNPNLDFEVLKLPLQRCGEACEEYGTIIAQCTKHSDDTSRPSVRDWIAQRYHQGDINDFRAMLAEYKSTISIGLADANLRIAAISPEALESYKDMIAGTTRDLERHLQNTQEKINRLTAGAAIDELVPGWHPKAEEKASTKQSLVTSNQTDILSNLQEGVQDFKLDKAEDLLVFRNTHFMVPFPSDPDFVNRPNIWTWIEQQYAGPESRFALVGLGGFGKSQMAIQFAYQVHATSPSTSVFWVHASTEATFDESYRSIADTLALPRRHDRDVNVLALVRDSLQRQIISPWLMIVDNADDFGMLFAKNGQEDGLQVPSALYLPKSPTGKILFTSRSWDAAEKLTGTGKTLLQVQTMEKTQALLLAQKKLHQHDEEAVVLRLAHTLDYIPLAVTQAAAYINKRSPRMTVQSYVGEFQKNEKRKGALLRSDRGDIRRYDTVSNSVMATWKVTFDQIRREHPQAANLLSLMSYFHSQNIPEFMLHGYKRGFVKAEGSDDEECDEVSDDEDFDDDLDILRGYSLVSVTSNAGFCEMHSLVQFCTKVWTTEFSNPIRWKNIFLQSASQHFPSGIFETWGLCQTLMPHIQPLLNEKPVEASGWLEWSELATNVSRYLRLLGDYFRAEVIVQGAVRIRTERLGKEHPLTLSSLANLALTYRNQGRWNEAEELCVRVMETRKRLLGEKHPDTLTSMASLSSTYMSQGRWKEAEELCVRVMETRKRLLGEKHPDTLTSMASLSSTYTSQGQWKEAEELCGLVVGMMQRVHGEEHPDTLTSMASLSSTYTSQGRWKEAEELCVRVMETRKRLLGEKHPDTLTSMASLSSTYTSQGRWKEAEELCVRVMETRKRLLGEKHPDTLTSMASLSSTYMSQGRWKEAEELSVRAVHRSLGLLTDNSTRTSNDKITDGKFIPELLRTAPFTDSGYASRPAGSGTVKEAAAAAFPQGIHSIAEEQVSTENFDEPIFPDNMTDYSTTSSVHLQDVGRYMLAVVEELVDMIPRSAVGNSDIMARLTEALPHLLKGFALMIGHCASTPLHRDIMFFVYKYRKDIVTRFQEYAEEDEDHAISPSVPGMTWTEKVDHWCNQDSTIRDESPQNVGDEQLPVQNYPMGNEDDEDQNEGGYEFENEEEDANEMRRSTEELSTPRHCLVNSSAYDWLRNAVAREILLVSAVPDIRYCIRQEVLSSLPPIRVSRHRDAHSYKAIFEMDWDPRTFLQQQKCGETSGNDIGMEITLTAPSQDAQALTARQYLSQIWPSIGEPVLRVIEGVLGEDRKEGQSTTLPDRTTVMARSTGSSFTVLAHGSATTIAELGELLSWLGAALRTSPREVGIVYCTPHIKKLNDWKFKPSVSPVKEIRFEVKFTFTEENAALPNGQCWHGMFRNPVVVREYPIAKRATTQTGMEMSLDTMACLVRTNRIVPFGATYYFKGFSSMLVLVAQKEGAFIWHHLHNPLGQRISYLDHKSNLSDIPTFQQLENARHIVGWCSEINFYAGAVDNNVNYDIENSSLPRPHSTCVLDKISISGGKFVSASVGMRLGVAQTPLHIARDTYFEKMNWVAKRYAVLWDEGENRGWLVNGPSALLHLVLASLHNDLCGKLKSEVLFDKQSLKIPTSRHTANSALQVLMEQQNKKLKIHIDKVETWTEETTGEGDAPPTTITKTKTTYTCFEDRVERMYCLLEQAMEHQTSIEGQDGLDLKLRVRKYLEGWDFKDFATGEDSIFPHVKTLQTRAKGWVDFIREINAITIFGKGFGEIISPTDAKSVCGSWAQQPLQKYYLAACISDLKDVPEIDFKYNEAKVGERLVWKIPDGLFKPCKCASDRTEKANHSHLIQVLAPQGKKNYSLPRSTGAVHLNDQGAVIFGYNPTFSLRWKDEGDPEEEELQENDVPESPQEAEFHDSAIGSPSASMNPGGRDAQTAFVQPVTSTPNRIKSRTMLNVEAEKHTRKTSSSGYEQDTESNDRTNDFCDPNDNRNQQLEEEPVPNVLNYGKESAEASNCLPAAV